MAEAVCRQRSSPAGELTAGVDEAGRGPLAGPVVASAVILGTGLRITGLADSKTLAPARRELLYEQVTASALAWSVAWADVTEIDTINILDATLLAMRRAILGLRLMPARVEIDGNRLPDLNFGGRTIGGQAVIRGDATRPAISAASIIAKVTRDRIMHSLDGVFPQYGFVRHKGYPTKIHRAALHRHGPCPQHRRSFRPLRRATD